MNVLLSLGYDSNPGHGSTIAQKKANVLQNSVLLRPSMCVQKTDGKGRKQKQGEDEVGRERDRLMVRFRRDRSAQSFMKGYRMAV